MVNPRLFHHLSFLPSSTKSRDFFSLLLQSAQSKSLRFCLESNIFKFPSTKYTSPSTSGIAFIYQGSYKFNNFFYVFRNLDVHLPFTFNDCASLKYFSMYSLISMDTPSSIALFIILSSASVKFEQLYLPSSIF